MVAGVWTGIRFSNLKNFRTRIRIKNFWNRSGVGIWKSDSRHLWCLCLMFSNCTGGRSFSKLRRIKNYIRSSTGQKMAKHAVSNEHGTWASFGYGPGDNHYRISRAKKSGVVKLFLPGIFFKSHIDRVTETRVTSINSLLSILRNVTLLQLPFNALT